MAKDSEMDPTPGSSEPIPDVATTLAKTAGSRSTSIPDHVKRSVGRKKKEEPTDRYTKDKDEPVTQEEYDALMADRPIKFGPKTSGFKRGGGKSNDSPCSHCVHYYNAPAAAIAMGKPTHATCELVRESSEKDEIKPDDTCRLFSKDGKTLPLLESKEEPAEA